MEMNMLALLYWQVQANAEVFKFQKLFRRTSTYRNWEKSGNILKSQK